ERARRAGMAAVTDRLHLADLVKGDVMFAATGVTDGAILSGVRRSHGTAVTHSLVMRARSGTIRFLESHHSHLFKADIAPGKR
ncbi:MAG: fructose-bisphosphatase class II, partial [Rhodospirillales bacterium]|nr:fructose-bisphosphatase class II [Rhodospirillales bacterium]